MAKGNRGGRRARGGSTSTENMTLEEYLKTTQTPIDVEDAYKGANPNYGQPYYDENCQRCVWAYELRRRGYDVEALPSTPGDVLPKQHNWLGLGVGMGEPSFADADAWDKWAHETLLYLDNNTWQKQYKTIANDLDEWGPGSRAFISVGWKGRGTGGHVFAVENVGGGKFKAIEPQTGEVVSLKDYLKKADRRTVAIYRSDNVEINYSEAHKYVKGEVIKDEK